MASVTSVRPPGDAPHKPTEIASGMPVGLFDDKARRRQRQDVIGLGDQQYSDVVNVRGSWDDFTKGVAQTHPRAIYRNDVLRYSDVGTTLVTPGVTLITDALPGERAARTGIVSRITNLSPVSDLFEKVEEARRHAIELLTAGGYTELAGRANHIPIVVAPRSKMPSEGFMTNAREFITREWQLLGFKDSGEAAVYAEQLPESMPIVVLSDKAINMWPQSDLTGLVVHEIGHEAIGSLDRGKRFSLRYGYPLGRVTNLSDDAVINNQWMPSLTLAYVYEQISSRANRSTLGKEILQNYGQWNEFIGKIRKTAEKPLQSEQENERGTISVVSDKDIEILAARETLAMLEMAFPDMRRSRTGGKVPVPPPGVLYALRKTKKAQGNAQIDAMLAQATKISQRFLKDLSADLYDLLLARDPRAAALGLERRVEPRVIPSSALRSGSASMAAIEHLLERMPTLPANSVTAKLTRKLTGGRLKGALLSPFAPIRADKVMEAYIDGMRAEAERIAEWVLEQGLRKGIIKLPFDLQKPDADPGSDEHKAWEDNFRLWKRVMAKSASASLMIQMAETLSPFGIFYQIGQGQFAMQMNAPERIRGLPIPRINDEALTAEEKSRAAKHTQYYLRLLRKRMRSQGGGELSVNLADALPPEWLVVTIAKIQRDAPKKKVGKPANSKKKPQPGVQYTPRELLSSDDEEQDPIEALNALMDALEALEEEEKRQSKEEQEQDAAQPADADDTDDQDGDDDALDDMGINIPTPNFSPFLGDAPPSDPEGGNHGGVSASGQQNPLQQQPEPEQEDAHNDPSSGDGIPADTIKDEDSDIARTGEGDGMVDDADDDGTKPEAADEADNDLAAGASAERDHSEDAKTRADIREVIDRIPKVGAEDLQNAWDADQQAQVEQNARAVRANDVKIEEGARGGQYSSGVGNQTPGRGGGGQILPSLIVSLDDEESAAWPIAILRGAAGVLGHHTTGHRKINLKKEDKVPKRRRGNTSSGGAAAERRLAKRIEAQLPQAPILLTLIDSSASMGEDDMRSAARVVLELARFMSEPNRLMARRVRREAKKLTQQLRQASQRSGEPIIVTSTTDDTGTTALEAAAAMCLPEEINSKNVEARLTPQGGGGTDMGAGVIAMAHWVASMIDKYKAHELTEAVLPSHPLLKISQTLATGTKKTLVGASPQAEAAEAIARMATEAQRATGRAQESRLVTVVVTDGFTPWATQADLHTAGDILRGALGIKTSAQAMQVIPIVTQRGGVEYTLSGLNKVDPTGEAYPVVFEVRGNGLRAYARSAEMKEALDAILGS